MQPVVSFCAPRTWRQGLIVFVVFQGLIQLSNYVLEVFFFEVGLDVLLKEMWVTFAISSPFVVFSLFMLRHQAVLQDRLESLARTDSLTGLPNRREFFRLAEQYDDLTGAALLMIDVDHFKQLNDTYGHAFGDECLQAIAGRLRDVVATSSVVGRIGGEEFAVLMPNCPLGEACRIGRAIAGQYGDSHPTPVAMTASVGIAAGQWGVSLSDVLRRADEALYAAKTSGRACAVKWSEAASTLTATPFLDADLPLGKGMSAV